MVDVGTVVDSEGCGWCPVSKQLLLTNLADLLLTFPLLALFKYLLLFKDLLLCQLGGLMVSSRLLLPFAEELLFLLLPKSICLFLLVLNILVDLLKNVSLTFGELFIFYLILAYFLLGLLLSKSSIGSFLGGNSFLLGFLLCRSLRLVVLSSC